MSKKLYVGGLPFSVTDGQLEELFSTHGTVESAKVITDQYTNKSRGFGFVELSSNDEAQKAINALNGTEIDGRTITVNEARQKENRGSDRGGGGRGGQRNRW
ncbi:MAG: RNA-binding protein [Candidatus Schekmanbacteria bacterium RBG_13_48_7]|uniref:RNA-binding protein n=1 Tax=Candidatus Schekmanbacteria bacterium RBG_13_48_7 TaxID=1817878 RepID=A0A1F7RNP1_9BACT|nr:MAG: RNA-binding protein [Candidatus Schekmanbacteria bacterium RBG_13_48_7]